ncbi:hypothetical protein ACKWTF_003927 [Chironomus riparius]
MARLLVFILCASMATTQRNGNVVKDKSDDVHEVQRQNKITEQILTSFLERKLYPNRKPRPGPTLDDILPLETRPTRNKHSTQKDNDDDDNESDNLQSVESEHVDTFYRSDCPNCVDDTIATPNRWTMPLLKLGEKRYYLGIFFKANWFRAAQYCRFHGMHLASISSQEENDRLEKHIRDFGKFRVENRVAIQAPVHR